MVDYQLVFFFSPFSALGSAFSYVSEPIPYPFHPGDADAFYSYMTTKLTPTGHWLLDYELYFGVLYISSVRFSIYTELPPPPPYGHYSPTSPKLPLGPYTAHHLNSSSDQMSPQGQSSGEMRRPGSSIIRTLSSLSM